MSPVDAELIAVDDYKGLAADWCALELTADGSPFTAWQWVSVWLRNLPAQTRPSVFRASDRDGLLALALLVNAPARKLRSLLGGNSLLLQETGNADIDEVTVEYSGLLVRRGSEVRAYSALFDTLTRIKQWQSLRISASPHARAVTASLPDGLDAFSAHEQPSYLVDLAAVRASGAEYISVLSSSTRYNLRRTRRAYEVHGEVRAEIAATPAQALDWLHELRTLHQRYWLGKGKRGQRGRLCRLQHDPVVGRDRRSELMAHEIQGVVEGGNRRDDTKKRRPGREYASALRTPSDIARINRAIVLEHCVRRECPDILGTRGFMQRVFQA